MKDTTKGRYFYLMLKDNFYDSDDMVLLESMENGYLYSNILLKLYLKSLKDKGKLMYKDRIPYNVEMLAKLTRHNVDVVRSAINIFQEMGIIEILDNGAIFMMDIENYIGKSSTEADRRRAYDRRIAAEKKLLVEKSPEKSHAYIDIELDIDIDKELDIKEKVKKEKISRFKKPTVDEVRAYCVERNNSIDAEHFIDYYESNGWKVGKNSMKDWKATVRNWEKRNSTSTSSKVSKQKYTTEELDKLLKPKKLTDVDQKAIDEAFAKGEII